MSGEVWKCDCGRKWTGHTEAHCATCHTHFTSDGAFDRHLASPKSDDACYPPATILRKDGTPALEAIQRKYGLVWRVRDDRQHPFSDFGAGVESPELPPSEASLSEPLEVVA